MQPKFDNMQSDINAYNFLIATKIAETDSHINDQNAILDIKIDSFDEEMKKRRIEFDIYVETENNRLESLRKSTLLDIETQNKVLTDITKVLANNDAQITKINTSITILESENKKSMNLKEEIDSKLVLVANKEIELDNREKTNKEVSEKNEKEKEDILKAYNSLKTKEEYITNKNEELNIRHSEYDNMFIKKNSILSEREKTIASKEIEIDSIEQ